MKILNLFLLVLALIPASTQAQSTGGSFGGGDWGNEADDSSSSSSSSGSSYDDSEARERREREEQERRERREREERERRELIRLDTLGNHRGSGSCSEVCGRIASDNSEDVRTCRTHCSAAPQLGWSLCNSNETSADELVACLRDVGGNYDVDALRSCDHAPRTDQMGCLRSIRGGRFDNTALGICNELDSRSRLGCLREIRDATFANAPLDICRRLPAAQQLECLQVVKNARFNDSEVLGLCAAMSTGNQVDCLESIRDGEFEGAPLRFCREMPEEDRRVGCLGAINNGEFEDQSLRFCRAMNPDDQAVCLRAVSNHRYSATDLMVCSSDRLSAYFQVECLRIQHDPSATYDPAVEICGEMDTLTRINACLRITSNGIAYPPAVRTECMRIATSEEPNSAYRAGQCLVDHLHTRLQTVRGR